MFRISHWRPPSRNTARSFIQQSKTEPPGKPVPSEPAPAAPNTPAAPENVKLSRRERVVNYLQMVKFDYKEALKEVRDFAVQKPGRASLYACLFGFSVYANQNNPDERSYRENFLLSSQELQQIGEPVRNPASQNLVDYVSRAYNAGLVRRLNLLVCSVMWVDDWDPGLGLYSAQCDLLRPGWIDIRHRVIDIGFLNTWWIAVGKMENCDVNTAEWREDGSPANQHSQLKQMW